MDPSFSLPWPSQMSVIKESFIERGDSLKNLANAFRTRTSYKDDEINMCVLSSVYPLVVLSEFLKESFYEELKTKLLPKLKYSERANDLYRFHQTGDLKVHPSSIITELKTSLLSSSFIGFVERIVGRALSKSHIDLSSQKYSKHDYLLNHDDRLDSRRVAFVLYLVDPAWESGDGGTLDFFPTNWNGEPTTLSLQRFVPKANTLVFFEVSMSSHHQVAEVLRDINGSRISIAGWFHDEGTEEHFDSCLSTPSFINPNMSTTKITNDIIIKDIFTPEFLMECSTYATFRRPDSRTIHTTFESFGYYQEIQEPLWMKSLSSRNFQAFLQGLLTTSRALDWPTRPIMKFYFERSHYKRNRKASIHECGGVIWVYIMISEDSKMNNVLRICENPISVSLGSNITLIEIEFSVIE